MKKTAALTSTLLVAAVLLFAGAVFGQAGASAAKPDCAVNPHPQACRTPTPTPTPPPTPTPTPPPGFCTTPDTITEGEAVSYFEAAALGGGEYLIHNNNWNDSYGGTHVIHACDYNLWNVDVNVPTHSDNAVEAYPNVHRDYHNWGTGYEPPLSNYPTLTSRFAATSPHVGIYNVAYDIWLNGVGNTGTSRNREVMIWTENFNQRPAGDVVASLTLSGYAWDLWSNGQDILTLAAPLSGDRPSNRAITSGTLDLRAALDYLIVTGRVPADSTLGQIGYGVETVTTGGTIQRFNFTDFYIAD